MAARAYWQGQIKLALVSIPVEIYPATRSGAAISFRQIHEPTGKPVHYDKVVAGVGPVDRDEILKGYEVAKGTYVLLEQEEIEAVKIESRKTLDLVQFVPADAIDVLYYEKPYFVVPADDLAEEAYAVLRDAMRRTGKVGLGQLSVRGREQLVSLKPCGRGLVLEVLRYADEVARAQSYFRGLPDKPADPDLLDLATAIIEKKTAPFRPEEFHDRYVDALHRLIDKKKKARGRRVIEEEEEAAAPKAGNVIDLMAALRKSVGEDGRAASASGRKAAAGKAPAPAKTPARRKAPAKRRSA
ncbi:non-homologous end joining protein Ku [Sphingobium jiangsuense]|uniref:Non-homologous end joining protein Ku n=1 Tax=Sphingobium jiangsuense TaxID=870476 RepID=A0A7W6BKB8_9SPHN|nr:Ku protein [Sphingobium jiangsuense]MBB3928655.1 DNA end-binding protein Ku [Sphingobium jiangsuense]GLT01292.1 non-homologous end joining protein Ku [Sphingobium jiangsuense]